MDIRHFNPRKKLTLKINISKNFNPKKILNRLKYYYDIKTKLISIFFYLFHVMYLNIFLREDDK